MADVYKIAIDSGTPAEIIPQPTSVGIQTTRRSVAADSTIYSESPYAILEFSALGSVAMYQSLLSQFGVLDGLTSPVTCYIRSEIFTFRTYRGIAVQPENGRDMEWNYFPRNVKILVRDLVLVVV